MPPSGQLEGSPNPWRRKWCLLASGCARSNLVECLGPYEIVSALGAALAGFVAFAPAFAEEDGGRGVAVGDNGDVHADITSSLPRSVKEQYVYYMGTFPQPQPWLPSK